MGIGACAHEKDGRVAVEFRAWTYAAEIWTGAWRTCLADGASLMVHGGQWLSLPAAGAVSPDGRRVAVCYI